jgi:hypothetical protein
MGRHQEVTSHDIFSPHSLQKTASAKFSFPQFGQNFVAAFSSTE